MSSLDARLPALDPKVNHPGPLSAVVSRPPPLNDAAITRVAVGITPRAVGSIGASSDGCDPRSSSTFASEWRVRCSVVDTLTADSEPIPTRPQRHHGPRDARRGARGPRHRGVPCRPAMASDSPHEQRGDGHPAARHGPRRLHNWLFWLSYGSRSTPCTPRARHRQPSRRGLLRQTTGRNGLSA